MLAMYHGDSFANLDLIISWFKVSQHTQVGCMANLDHGALTILTAVLAKTKTHRLKEPLQARGIHHLDVLQVGKAQ
jgi:hypothetical protein